MTLPYLLCATQARGLLEKNIITVEEYACSLLGRIEKRDSIVKAWAYLDPAFILDQARALDKIPHDQRGPLHGLAIGIEDITNTKDMPTQFGSLIYKGHQPSLDSSAVAILRSAGALIFGKTTTTEFAVANSGPDTTNPRNPVHTPGGSSCGSAAAVADFQVPLSLGSQTGGSTIRPASYTGIFAMKPTHNAVSVEGQKSFAPTFDTLGFFARSIEDLQLLADVFLLKDDRTPREIPMKDISIALVKTPMWSQAGPSTIAAINYAVEALQSKGVQIEDVSFPSEVPDSSVLEQVAMAITCSEGQVSFLREYRLDRAKLHPTVRGLVENSANYTKKQRTEAFDDYARIRHIVNKMAEKYSVILTPSAVDEAPLGLGFMGAPTFNTFWTGCHMPVINIPAFTGARGLPIGISLVAPRFCDQQLLKTSKLLSEVLKLGGSRGVKVSDEASSSHALSVSSRLSIKLCIDPFPTG